MIVTKGTLDWAYPPFILATTAAAMGLDVTMFFTFYGLPLSEEEARSAGYVARQSGDEDADDGHACRHAESGLRASRRRRGGDGDDEEPHQEKGVASIEELRDGGGRIPRSR